jgi:hypothetical protein
MAHVELRPFKAEHVLTLAKPRNSLEAMAIMRDEEKLRLFEDVGIGFAGYVGDDLIGCAGIFQNIQEEWEVWFLGTPLVDKYPLAFHRAVMKWFPTVCKAAGLGRVVAHVRPDMEREIRWVRALGFRAREIVDLTLWGNETPTLYILFEREA